MMTSKIFASALVIIYSIRTNTIHNQHFNSQIFDYYYILFFLENEIIIIILIMHML